MHTIHSRWRKPKKRKNRRAIAMQFAHMKRKINLEKEKSSNTSESTDENSLMENNDRLTKKPVMDGRTFTKHLKLLAIESNRLKNSLLRETRKCVAEAYICCNPDLISQDVLDIAVCYDGLWQIRDSNSVYGIGCVIDILTGLVVDFGILSNYCYLCSVAGKELGVATDEYKIWETDHIDNGDCSKNYIGPSNSIDIIATDILWQRSIRHCNMRFTTLLCCNDIPVFNHLSTSNLYNVSIKKENCIDYILQWLDIGLRAIVKKSRKQNLYLGGKKEGMLKMETIKKLVNEYKKAIVENSPNIKEIKSTIFATLEHSASTDDNPRHDKCPMGNASWCFYNRAIFNEQKPGSHSTEVTMKLNSIVMDKISPLYEILTADELLSRCVHNESKTTNKRLYATFWKKCTEEVLRSKKRMELAAVSAISEFNMGATAKLSIKLKELDNKMNIFAAAVDIANQRDKERNSKSINENVKKSKTQQSSFENFGKVKENARHAE